VHCLPQAVPVPLPISGQLFMIVQVEAPSIAFPPSREGVYALVHLEQWAAPTGLGRPRR
jgi:hypothetical protein